MKDIDNDINKTMFELNQRIILLRKKHGYSYKKLEELTGISHSTLQRYEKNPYASITMSKLNAIADAYNVSPSYLMGMESKDLPYDYYKSIIPLLEEDGYTITYHSEDESFTLDSSNTTTTINVEQIKSLKETTKSYFKFKLSEIIKPPSAE